MSEFQYSGKGLPCPVCGRDKDGDCRIQPGFVLCHTLQEKQDLPAWKYLGLTDIWGQWLKVSKEPRLNGSTKLTKHYAYPTRDGQPLAKVERIDRREQDGTTKKTFTQHHWSGSKFLPGLPKDRRDAIAIYRYAEVQNAISRGEKIFWVEGEATCDALWKIGIAATTSIGGSGGFSRYGRYEDDLKGGIVVLSPDRDSQGVKYSKEVQSLFSGTLWCKFGPHRAWEQEYLPEKGGLDLLDWIEQGATKEDILNAIEDESDDGDDNFGLILAETEAALAIEGVRKSYELTRLAKKHRCSVSQLIAWHEGNEIEHSTIEAKPFFDLMADRIAYLSSIDGVPSNWLSTGFSALDYQLGGGLRPGSLLTVAGATGAGKSAFCLSSLLMNLRKGSKPRTLLVSAEMSKEDVIDKLVSSHSKINLSHISRGIPERDWTNIYKSCEDIGELKLFIHDCPTDIEGIRNQALAAQKHFGGLDLIIIDYLQLMKSSISGRRRDEEIAEITRGAKQLAMELQIPIIAAAQVNRSVDSRPDKRPRLSDIRESGTIEQDSSYVVFIYREEYYDPNTSDRGIAEFILAKNRFGPTGTVKASFFDGEFTDLPY